MTVFSTLTSALRSLTHVDDVFWENEVRANYLNAIIMLVSAAALAIAVLLNIVGVFQTGPRIYSIGIQGVFELAVPAALCLHYKGEKWWLKYVLIAFFLFACARLSAVLSYNVSYIMIIPVIMSSRYFSRSFTMVIGGISILLVLTSDLFSLFYGVIDLNYYPKLPVGTELVVETTLKQAIVDLGIPASQIIRNYLTLIFIPKLVMLMIIIMVCTLIAERGHKMVLDGAEVSSNAAALETELNTANEIQTGMLPRIFPPFPEYEEFDLFASMNPAKEVGGDFYDFFLIDEDHLGLVMADVSGKGVPAALFMMASKILINDRASMGGTPSEVLTFVNEAICANNEAEMFVTVWLGILDIRTGKITASNAGHEYPIVKHANGNFELLHDKHGFVVGGLEGAPYTDYEIQLEPGSTLFLYTDGVAEATNAQNELFGTKRILEVLNQHKDDPVDEVICSMSMGIDEFVGDAPQFDDVTMLCLKYFGAKDTSAEAESVQTKANDMQTKADDSQQSQNGGTIVNEMTIEATVDNIETVTDFVNAELEKLDCPLKAQTQIDIAIDELFGNIANYAYDPETGPATVRVEVDESPLAVVITFIDHGKPYDPLAADDPDVTLSAEEREIGGLGVFLVKQTMDDVSYEYKDGQNILRIKKHM